MSCSRRLARQAITLLLPARDSAITSCEMHRALHGQSIASNAVRQNALYSTSQARLWPGCLPHLASTRQQHSNCSQSAPLLGRRQPWRLPGGHVRPPAAAADFTASTPAHGLPADDDGPEGELHAVETAIRANALIFAAKLAVFFMSNSRCALNGRQDSRKTSSCAITNGSVCGWANARCQSTTNSSREALQPCSVRCLQTVMSCVSPVMLLGCFPSAADRAELLCCMHAYVEVLPKPLMVWSASTECSPEAGVLLISSPGSVLCAWQFLRAYHTASS